MRKENDPQDTQESLTAYYRLHSKIYDATRWSFLFGRHHLVELVASHASPARILEVGCGTGTNLVRLARAFPQAELSGLDISEHMLERAQRKVKTLGNPFRPLHRAYDAPIRTDSGFDLIVFSYSLSMFNPGWEQALENALHDLAPGGLIAVVDFHESTFRLFSGWMKTNRVRMEGHLLEGLRSRFRPRSMSTCPAFLGLWTYFHFLGESHESIRSHRCKGARRAHGEVDSDT